MALIANGVARKSLAPFIHDDIDFYAHQVEGIRTMSRRKSGLLCDDMGLGKSIQILTVFAMDVYRGWGSKAIVVAPATLKGNWSDEIGKFTGFSQIVLNGTPKERREQLGEFEAITGPKILVVNYEQVTAHFDVLNKFRFDFGVFDEAHYMKNPKSKRTKSSLDLYSRRSWMLTGTPMLNNVNELWTLLHKVNPDRFPKYWSFVNRYCVFGGYQDKQIVGVKNEAELTDILQEYMIRRLKKDVLDLPDVQEIERRVDLLPEQRKIYDSVANDMILPRADSEPQDIENALTRFLRLKQICGTTIPFTEHDYSAKLDLAIEDEVEILSNGHKTVVFTQFRTVQAAYIARIKKYGYPVFELNGDVPINMRQEVVKTWALASGPAVIVCTLQVAGVGLNMTAASHGSFIDELFVPGLNKQATDRLHRIGASETQPIQIRRYIARNTIETRIRAILRTKTRLNDTIVESDPDWKRKLIAAMAEDEEVA